VSVGLGIKDACGQFVGTIWLKTTIWAFLQACHPYKKISRTTNLSGLQKFRSIFWHNRVKYRQLHTGKKFRARTDTRGVVSNSVTQDQHILPEFHGLDKNVWFLADFIRKYTEF